MSFYPLVQLRRVASQSSLNGATFRCSVFFTEEMVDLVEQCQYLREIDGQELHGETPDLNRYLDRETELSFRMPRNSSSQFYQNWNAFLNNFTFSSAENDELPEFYLFEEDSYYSSNTQESDQSDKFQRLELLVRSVAKLEHLAHYHDGKSAGIRTLVFLSGERKTPIVLEVSISEQLLSKDINFSLLHELTAPESEMNLHYSDKLSVFYASLHEFLNRNQTSSEAFQQLVDSWDGFVRLYRNNLATYLSGFSFQKAKRDVAEAEVELSEKLTNLTSDIIFKLFSVPATVIALAAILQRGQLDIMVLCLLFIGVAVTITLMLGLLKSQESKYHSLSKAKDLVFKSIDGEASDFPQELSNEISEVKGRLDEHFKSTQKWLNGFKFAIFTPVIAIVLFVIIA